MFYIVPQAPIPGEDTLDCEMARTVDNAERRAAQEQARTNVEHKVVEVTNHACCDHTRILESA